MSMVNHINQIQRIHEWNEIAGNTSIKRSLDDAQVVGQYNLIREEFNELVEAFIQGDRIEVYDALADLITVATGMCHMMGQNMEDVLSIVNDSNYSKFVDENNQEEVDAVFDSYYEDPRYTNISIHKGVIWGTVRETGSRKILKGVNYHPPRWEELGDDV